MFKNADTLDCSNFKMNKDDEQGRIEEMLLKAQKLKSVEIKDGTFFLPDDCKKFEGKGRWALHVKEGKLVKIDGEQRADSTNNKSK